METPNINDYLDSIDSDIDSKVVPPKRDFSGKRTMSEGESCIHKRWEKPIKQKADNYHNIIEQLKRIKREAISKIEELRKLQKNFVDQMKTHKDKILKYENEIKRLNENIDYYHKLNSIGIGRLEEAQYKQKVSRKNTNLFSNILLIIIVEAVVFAATWMIQRETLPWDSIIIRFIFLVCIGAASVFQLYQYQKSGRKTIKAIHNITLFLGFICIIDGLLVGYFMGDTTTSTTLDFNLVDQVNTEQQSNNKDITSILVKFPGIVEFLCSVLLLFISKMLMADTLGRGKVEIQEPSKTIGWSSTSLKMAIMNAKISKLTKLMEEEYLKIRQCEAENTARIEKEHQVCDKIKEDIKELTNKIPTIKEEINNDIMNEKREFDYYRTLYLEILSLKPDTASTPTPYYEAVTENDIRQYNSIDI